MRLITSMSRIFFEKAIFSEIFLKFPSFSRFSPKSLTNNALRSKLSVCKRL